MIHTWYNHFDVCIIHPSTGTMKTEYRKEGDLLEKYESISLSEQETTISYNRDEDHAIVWTNDRTMITKLDKLCREAPENYQCIEVGKAGIGGGILDKRYRINDKGLLTFRQRRVKLNLTDDQRAALVERAKRLNNAE